MNSRNKWYPEFQEYILKRITSNGMKYEMKRTLSIIYMSFKVEAFPKGQHNYLIERGKGLPRIKTYYRLY